MSRIIANASGVKIARTIWLDRNSRLVTINRIVRTVSDNDSPNVATLVNNPSLASVARSSFHSMDAIGTTIVSTVKGQAVELT
jgi:hypothetical protein